MIILALLPIISLLICLIGFKLSVVKAGSISLSIAFVVALGFFGLDVFGLVVAVGKAWSLALFVSLIVWCAIFLYHLANGFKAIEVINKNIVVYIEDKFVQFLFLSWLFTGLLQGMAGFGVPIVIITPILIALGFDKVKSLTAALLGHSWAVTFGSMGAAYFIIQMITGIPLEDLGVPVWMFNTIAHILTGIGVCWLYDGIKGIKKGLPYILPTSAVMATVQYFTIVFGMYSLATLNTALFGLATMFALYKLRAKSKPHNGVYAGSLTLWQSVLPYIVILGLSLGFQFLPDILKNISLSFRFPGAETALGHIVQPETGYAKIRLFGHPAVILLCAAVVAVITYRRAHIWNTSIFQTAVKKTVKKCVPATFALLVMSSMSLIMMDSGMMYRLAKTTADLMGNLYPIAAPFIGILASFLTGNNTNANVMFGGFQYTIAQELNVSGAVMSAAQSISGAVGVAIGPTLVLMGAIAAKLTGKESLILKKLIFIVLIIALIMGIMNYILLSVLQYGVTT